MPFTDYPSGVTSFGCPLPGFNVPLNGRKHWFVRGVSTAAVGDVLGQDGNPGDSWERPLRTMARAFQLVGSGDVIHFNGNIREQVVTPVGVFDVTIIGEGTRPRNADAHTNNNGYFAATWRAPAAPVAATPLVQVMQQGWRFINILFNPPADAAAIQLYKDAGAGDLERDAGHCHIFGCRFTGGQDGVEIIETGFTRIENCQFILHTGFAIKSTAGPGISLPGWSQIINNWFQDNANNIQASFSRSLITKNYFGVLTGAGQYLDMNGAAGVANIVYDNYFAGIYSVAGGYSAAAGGTDDWGGNWNTGVGILTSANPV